MKTMILLFLITLNLTGCMSGLSFDSLQFDRFLSISERAEHLVKSCSDQQAIKIGSAVMLDNVTHMDNYGQHRGTSPEIAKSVSILHSMISELDVRYNNPTVPSTIYCKEKLRTISTTALAISDTIGRLN